MWFTVFALAQGGTVDPKAKCPDATPRTPECCTANKTAPVMGGIDFVDLAGKTQGKDGPVYSGMKFTSLLNGYTFGFLSQANKDTFDADPWSYAPAWGGF
jgi:YHS domain-containing protein